MASACRQFVNRASLSSIRSAVRSSVPNSSASRFPLPTASSPSSAPFRRFSLSRCVGMRSVTASTPQRGGGGEVDVVAEHYIEELPSALTGAWSVRSEVIRSRLSQLQEVTLHKIGKANSL